MLTKLRVIYKNIMKFDYDNLRTRHSAEINGASDVKPDPLECFKEFYEMQNGQCMNDDQVSFMSGIIKEIWEEH